MTCFLTKEICVYNYEFVNPIMTLKYIQITSAFLLPFSLYGARSYFFSVSYVVFFYAFSQTVVHAADGQNGALIIGSAGCTVHSTSGPGGSLYAAESDPALLHRKKHAKFSLHSTGKCWCLV
jgi:hypothetical protein